MVGKVRDALWAPAFIGDFVAGHCGRVDLPTHNDDRWKFLRGNVDVLPESPTRERYHAPDLTAQFVIAARAG